MNILWHIHAYPPIHNAGAEWMAHDMNRFLVKNHNVKVLTSWDGEFEGIPVINDDNLVHMNEQYRWADIIFSHLGRSGMAYNKSRQYCKPLVFVSHNTHPYHFCKHDRTEGVYVVHNAQWSMDILQYKRPGIVVNPPVNYRQWTRSTGELIALVNLNDNKGGAVLERIARAMPGKRFLGVKGMYGKQHDSYPDNVEVIDNTPDMQAVYDRCGIILMPSDYESWGRVATEALACGIPVIAHPAKGLLENLGWMGIFRERDDTDAWVKAIRNLDNKESYLTASQNALRRAKELDPTPQMERLDKFIHDIHNRKI